MKVSIITAMWQRHEVFKMFAQGARTLKANSAIQIELIAVGSEGKISRNLAQDNGFIYLEHKNAPLADKHNAALSKAQQINSDYVFCLGSDDIVTPELFKIYEKQIALGVDFIGVLDFYFYEIETQRAAYWGGYIDKPRIRHTCGAARMLSKNLLRKLGWKIWEKRHSHILDDSLQEKLSNIKYTEHIFAQRDYGIVGGLDIKSSVNMTPFELWENTTYIDKEIIYNNFPCVVS